MLALLVPFDGSTGSHRAVDLVIKLHREVGPIHVHLLHLLMPDDGFDVGATPQLAGPKLEGEHANARQAIASAVALLKREGVAYTSEVKTGLVPPTIVAYGRTMNAMAS